jgi:hypothetical protein
MVFDWLRGRKAEEDTLRASAGAEKVVSAIKALKEIGVTLQEEEGMSKEEKGIVRTANSMKDSPHTQINFFEKTLREAKVPFDFLQKIAGHLEGLYAKFSPKDRKSKTETMYEILSMRSAGESGRGFFQAKLAGASSVAAGLLGFALIVLGLSFFGRFTGFAISENNVASINMLGLILLIAGIISVYVAVRKHYK